MSDSEYYNSSDSEPFEPAGDDIFAEAYVNKFIALSTKRKFKYIRLSAGSKYDCLTSGGK